MKQNLIKILSDTIKLQPAVILYSMVSVGSKLASGHIPPWNHSLNDFIYDCLHDKCLLVIVFTMFIALAVYAFIWQRCIKGMSVLIMYANKSSYILWTQLAAVILFKEKVCFNNYAGILIIFVGIMVVNNHGQTNV